MKHSLYDRLLQRELGNISRYSSVKGLYGDRAWIEDLDIVNVLGGHSGCVNALSWSSSGRLLASGSDDQHLNIHSYQPESSVSQFALTTTLSTGHTENIFSVKFMPHSNDATLVTCAGDSEVRVFDIEHSSQNALASSTNSPTSSRRPKNLGNLYKGVRYLSFGDTNTRVYRSHADRVKRIVTESSPHLFLTCSEDGEVRQFDLRLPSGAYPAPKGGRGLFAHRTSHDDSNVPPPLISYKRYHLDLNTISCSASQPHYIALGGAHLHCFLHDRRMLGRDLFTERGDPGSYSPSASHSSRENESLGQATRCVRKFAPSGKKRMGRADNGHITACKISDANPNEMIASWSGDYIYSFDLIKSPDAHDTSPQSVQTHISQNNKGKQESLDRKRKRRSQNSVDRCKSKSRQVSHSGDEDGDMSLRVQYENGQSELINMESQGAVMPQAVAQSARNLVLTEAQKRSLRIAQSVVKIRKWMFALELQSRVSEEAARSGYTAHASSFTSALELATSCLLDMDDVVASWRYPMDPLEEDVMLQQTLRSNRGLSRRFVQAAGTLAKLLGGQFQATGRSPCDALRLFEQVIPSPFEDPRVSQTQIFNYEFLRAITLWLDGGTSALLQGFKRPKNQRLDNPRFPVPDEAQLSGIDDFIIPYLLQLSQDHPVPNVDASRFERNETRNTFDTETAAVKAFSHAVRIPLQDLSSEITPTTPALSAGTPSLAVQDRKTAINFWGFKVGRGILMTGGQCVNHQIVDLAFGGLGRVQAEEGRNQEDIDPDEIDDVVESVNLVKQSKSKSHGKLAAIHCKESSNSSESNESASVSDPAQHLGQSPRNSVEAMETASDEEVSLTEDIHSEITDHVDNDHENDEDQDGNNDDNNEDDDNHDALDDDEELSAEERHLIFQSTSDRGELREEVERGIACFSHTRQYQGHCNIKTVKDANFFGLQDEYVVSGSDSGHLFIWDKKTSELLNILEGDADVVNVVQGHPYEPLIAVSGIDHTIKIFSPDSRAQRDAAIGINIGSSSNDSTGAPSSTGKRRDRSASNKSNGDTGVGLHSRKRMHQSYQIVSQNDVERRGGMREAYITRSMLNQLTAYLRAREGGSLNGEIGADAEGRTIILSDNCSIM